MAEPHKDLTGAAPERSDGTVAANVVVVGSVNLDLVVSVPHLPAPGETILGDDLVYRAGGKGGNQAVGAHRLGANTTLIAMTGDDPLGSDLRAALAREGLDLTHVGEVAGTATGVAMIVVADGGENSIVVAPGANRLLQPSTVSGLDVALRAADALVLQGEVPAPASHEAASLARTSGATVVLNSAPLPALPDPDLEKLLGATDVLVVNEGEAAQLLGIEPPTTPEEWAALAPRLSELGPASAVVTLGAAGAVASESGTAYVQAAFAVDVVDTTGAGDSFTAALAVALAGGRPMADALRRACAAGALATTRLGAQAALPTLDELDTFLATGGGEHDA